MQWEGEAAQPVSMRTKKLENHEQVSATPRPTHDHVLRFLRTKLGRGWTRGRARGYLGDVVALAAFIPVVVRGRPSRRSVEWAVRYCTWRCDGQGADALAIDRYAPPPVLVERHAQWPDHGAF